ncbi:MULTISPECIES: hypothetical protein [Streptomyces]|uniref:hypothetical protein n=1 Tax=Streptomyces TaxID=1883 RepID=UPI00201D2AB5|nr:hypothetical protein [Streptomyces panaciradicis]MCL6675028.1 hypothetical protein [Streptomyces panaciradicis]
MYLVHVYLRSHPRGCVLPDWTAAAVARCGAEVDGFEHVSVHPAPASAPTVGIFLRASSLEEAETAAESLWRRTCAAQPLLGGWELRSAEVPLIAPEYLSWHAE